jgi:hypothetical protein
MQQEDWLMKQINLLGRVLGKILADLLGLKSQGQVGLGIEAAEQTLKNELDLDIDDLILIPTDQFIKTLQEGKNFSDEDLEKLADIFFLIAEDHDQSGIDADKKKKLYERSLTMHEYLDRKGSTYSFDRHIKIEKMKKAILLFALIMFTLISFSQSEEMSDKYLNNSLPDGSTPYANCYGPNQDCLDMGCSEIRVKTPANSDVLVIIKSGGKVVRHAYISAGSSYKFEVPDGTYQPFFYYGKGWNPEKPMKSTPECILLGGFISQESFGKENPQNLTNNILEYELILQQDGNFSTIPCNTGEVF